jgi:acetyl esterase/lipase
VDFLDRIDQELRPILESPLVPELNFGAGIDRVRAAMLQQRAALVTPDIPEVKTRDVVVPGYSDADPPLTLRIYEPETRAGDALLFWIHGGGMVVGTYDDNDYLCKIWAKKNGCVVTSVDYRLAPEHPYPAPLHDCYAALRWVSHELSSEVVVVGGSAGGGLAAGTVLLARDLGEVAVRAQILMYPMIDDRDVNPSCVDMTYPKVWNRAANQYGWASYLGERAAGDDVPIYAAPARATVEELRGLPPAFIDVGELDAFRDEDIAYAHKLMQAGVPCELLVTPGAFHGSEQYNLKAPTSRRINAARFDAIRRALA